MNPLALFERSASGAVGRKSAGREDEAGTAEEEEEEEETVNRLERLFPKFESKEGPFMPVADVTAVVSSSGPRARFLPLSEADDGRIDDEGFS